MATDLDRNLTLSAGDVVLLRGDDATAQRLLLRLGTNQGEWPYNRAFGMPWLFSVLGQSGDSSAQRQLAREVLEADPEVESVQIVRVDFDRANRRNTMQIACRLKSGSEVQAAT